MTHEVESLAYVKHTERDVPWHGLGVPVDRAMTAQEAIAFAGMDWEVEPRTVCTRRVDGSLVAHDGQVAVTRVTDDRVYQITSAPYRPVQPRECVGFLDALVGTGVAAYDTAGSLRHGAVIFTAANLDRRIDVAGIDRLDLYLMVRNSYDGSLPFGVDVTPIRPVCMNTVIFGVRGARRTWSMPPGGSPEQQVRQAWRALGMAEEYTVALETDLGRLVEQPVPLGDFERLTRRLGMVRTSADRARWEADQKALVGLFESSPTLSDEVRYTAYGALQTVIEHLDWSQPTSGSSGDTTAEVRMQTALGWSGHKPAVLRRMQHLLALEFDSRRSWGLDGKPNLDAHRPALAESPPRLDPQPGTQAQEVVPPSFTRSGR